MHFFIPCNVLFYLFTKTSNEIKRFVLLATSFPGLSPQMLKRRTFSFRLQVAQVNLVLILFTDHLNLKRGFSVTRIRGKNN